MAVNGDWLTVQDAAKLSGYHPEHITRLIKEKKIIARKLSVIWLVDRESLLGYLKRAQAMGEKRGRKPEK